MIKNLFKPIDLTNGKIYKVIILFMIPIFLSYIFQQIYTLTDAIIVGQNLTASEVNGVNDVGSLTFIILQFAYGCTAGFSVVSSAKRGKGDNDGLRQSFFVQFVLGLIVSIILTALSVFFIDPLLSLVGLTKSHGGATYEAARTYLFIIFLGTIFQVAYNQVCSLLRSIGDSMTPLIFLIISTILNIILDLIFIILFNWGVAGAAIATILAQGLSALFCYIYSFIKYPFLRFKKEDLKIRFKFYYEHLKLGLPLAFQFSILGIGLITMQNTIVKFDTTIEGIVIDNGPAQLAYGAVNKLQTFLFCPLNALGTAMLSYCGQNKGANKLDRIKSGINQSFIIMLIIVVFELFVASFLLIDNVFMNIFYSSTSINEKSAYLGRLNLLTVMPFLPAIGALFILRSSIQGLEKPIIPFICGISELFARILMCSFGPYIFIDTISTSIDPFTTPLPFISTYLADPFAWLVALIPLFIGYFLYVYRPYKLNKVKSLG